MFITSSNGRNFYDTSLSRFCKNPSSENSLESFAIHHVFYHVIHIGFNPFQLQCEVDDISKRQKYDYIQTMELFIEGLLANETRIFFISAVP